MVIAYVRAHQERSETPTAKHYLKNEATGSPRVFVFDTETTIDKRQNLKVGFFRVIEGKTVLSEGFFYDERFCSKKEISIIQAFSNKTGIRVYARQEFIDEMFFLFLIGDRALCVGFNLPFDLSRLALRCTFTKGERFHNGFSFQLSENISFPFLKIKVGNERATIEFNLLRDAVENYRGRFLDLHTLGFALSGEKHLTLRRTGELFNAKVLKTEAKSHGEINEPYLEYLANDVLATHSLYEALLEELTKYSLNIAPEKVVSSATLGKQLLRQLGIKTFREQNPSFDKEMLGYIMNTYYGGRSEVNIRKKPVQASVLDVTSMYPSINILMKLDKLLLAETIGHEDATKEIQDFLDNITPESLATMKDWSILASIAQLTTNNDIMPVRTRFCKDETLTNIGICELTSDVSMWYNVADLVASKFLSDKTPRITKGIRFIPCGQQKTLRETTILDITLDARKRNIYLDLVQERQRIKNTMKSRARAIKTMINSNCYGIYVETNPEHHRSSINLYGAETFTVESVFEAQGNAYNPLIATSTTAGARLIIAIIETLLKRKGLHHAFCDTDSMAVPCKAAKEIQEFFQKISPYGEGIDFLKEEHYKVWFYGISAKRYALYKKKGNNIEIVKHSLHGLGYLRNPFGEKVDWQREIWKDILKIHYKIITQEEFCQKYSESYSVGKLAITTQEQWKRIKKLNEGNSYAEQIKPFNFTTVGFGMEKAKGKIIKPIAPFTNNSQEAPYAPFIDANTGQELCGIEYWKPLIDTLHQYMNHPESKLEGETGVLKRRHLHITGLTLCGKEVRNIDTQILKLEKPTNYTDDNTLRKIILNMTTIEARQKGISRQTLHQLKKRATKKEPILITEKIKRKII